MRGAGRRATVGGAEGVGEWCFERTDELTDNPIDEAELNVTLTVDFLRAFKRARRAWSFADADADGGLVDGIVSACEYMEYVSRYIGR